MMAASMRHVKRRERLKIRNRMKKDGRKKSEFLSDQAWKPFEVDMSVFADDEMGGFVGMEVLTDYDPELLRKYTGGTTVKHKSLVSSDEDEASNSTEGGKGKAAKGKVKQMSKKQSEKSDAAKKKIQSEKKKTQAERKKKRRAERKMIEKEKSLVRKDGTTRENTVRTKLDTDNLDKKSIGSTKTSKNGENESKGKRDGTDNKESTLGDTKTEEDGKKEDDGQKEKKRKRKSGREQLEELKMKRKRRRSEQIGETDGRTADKEVIQSEVTSEGIAETSVEVPMTSWDSLSIPTAVHKALQSMGFSHPTPIQTGCIPAAIGERRDIVGAAETGSGKTLAFGIPLIYWLLRHKAQASSGRHQNATTGSTASGTITEEKSRLENDENIVRTRDKEDEEEGEKGERKEGGQKMKRKLHQTKLKEDHLSTMSLDEKAAMNGDDDEDEEEEEDSDSDGSDEYLDFDEDDDEDDDDGDVRNDLQKLKSQIGCVKVVDEIGDKEWTEVGLPLVSTPVNQRVYEEKLFGLVLTPTRELAVQVKNHLVAAAKMTDIKIAVVVGGMSAEKQKRVLKKKPDIIVGTPGRLWELYRLGEPHLSSLPDIQCLVIDEADRMVEKGHYAELSEILDLLDSSANKSTRQIFVFSATLSLIHLGPYRKSLKKAFKMDKKEKLDSVIGKVGVKENAHVVDLTKKEGTASTLLESKIVCEVEEKDIYLFYFLRQYPGRTLVFTNSIDCIRRLVSILSLLQCQPLPLHSSMHQKQRLKNLERFTSNPRGLLLATDVAARGLDIPDVEHVIHYQVPRTSESYVHRSGRTARQAKTGLSVTFIAPSEINFYRRLCKTLNREELPSFPIEHSYYQAVKERVDVARDIDKLEHVNSKKKHQNDWFVKAAKELDVDLDEDMNLHDMGDSSEQKQFTKKIKMMRTHLKTLLKKKIFASGTSQLYLTSSGKLLSPLSPASSGAHQAVAKLQARMKKDQTDDRKEKEKKRKKFKRMGRYLKS